VPLLCELLVPATGAQLDQAGDDCGAYDRDIRPGLVVKVIADNQAHGVEPALWKVEGLETVESAQQVAGQATAGGRLADLIVLGRDAPARRLGHWLEVASQVPAFAGFAIGRSIWEDVVREYEASDYGATGAGNARSKIAERYLGLRRALDAPCASASMNEVAGRRPPDAGLRPNFFCSPASGCVASAAPHPPDNCRVRPGGRPGPPRGAWP
jgi:hypothetical protein